MTSFTLKGWVFLSHAGPKVRKSRKITWFLGIRQNRNKDQCHVTYRMRNPGKLPAFWIRYVFNFELWFYDFTNLTYLVSLRMEKVGKLPGISQRIRRYVESSLKINLSMISLTYVHASAKIHLIHLHLMGSYIAS